MDTMVVYSSRTGNTKMIAKQIFAAIPGDLKDMQTVEEYSGKQADTFFVGFWTDKGTCDMSVIDLLSELHGKNIALFGTCGTSADPDYYRSVEQQVKVWIPEDNHYLGFFMCQGKMPMRVRNKYEMMMERCREPLQKEAFLKKFDEALLHPDSKDLDRAAVFAVQMLDRAAENEC